MVKNGNKIIFLTFVRRGFSGYAPARGLVRPWDQQFHGVHHGHGRKLTWTCFDQCDKVIRCQYCIVN